VDLYAHLVATYSWFLSLFPAQLHWVVTLAIILFMISLMVGLIRRHVLFALLLIPLVPVLWPVITAFVTDIGAFFVYLLHTAGA
jgi:NADH:ubiquinone oxidoreductase subunit K